MKTALAILLSSLFMSSSFADDRVNGYRCLAKLKGEKRYFPTVTCRKLENAKRVAREWCLTARKSSPNTTCVYHGCKRSVFIPLDREMLDMFNGFDSCNEIK